MDADATPSRTPEPGGGASSAQQQPRWAWWVVGIVVPLLAALVTVLLTDFSFSNPPGKSSGGTASTDGGGGATPDGKSKVRTGPETLDVEYMQYIDLDSKPISVIDFDDPVSPGTDFKVETQNDEVHLVPYAGESDRKLAEAPSSGHAPTEAECIGHLHNDRVTSARLTRGARFCAWTDEDRVAYFDVLSASETPASSRLKVTVWELPE